MFLEDQNLEEAIQNKDRIGIGEALLKPIVEVLEYETASNKMFTAGKDLKDAAEIKLSAPINLFMLTEAALAVEQDRARQRLAYQQDIGAIEVLRRDEPLRCKSFKEAIEKIMEIFDQRRLVCSAMFIPRMLVTDLVNQLSDRVDTVGQRELVLAGYLGTLMNAMLITNAANYAFEITEDNEIFAVDETKCKREIVSDFKCVEVNKSGYHVHFDATIKFDVIDPQGVVWAEIDKK
jgi:hypothetical protein